MCAISFNLFTVTAFMRFETFTGYGLVLASGAVIIKKIKEKKKKEKNSKLTPIPFSNPSNPYRDSSVNKKPCPVDKKIDTVSARILQRTPLLPTFYSVPLTSLRVVTL